MQITFKKLNILYRSKNSIQLLILLVVCGILNTRASFLKADELRAHPSSIVFNAVQGQSINVTRSIFIYTAFGTTINWNQSCDVSWLTANLQNGETEDILKIGVSSSGMTTGIYHGNVILQSAQSSTGPIIIPVTLILNPDVPVTITTWKDGFDGAMSVSVDDGKESGFSALQASGLKGTFVTPGTIPPSFYTYYYNAGMELGTHLASHICTSFSDDLLRYQEIEPNILGICNNTPILNKDLISLVWPCGYTNYREQAVASEYFLSARGYNINELEDATPDNFMNLKSYNSHEHPPYPPSDLKTVVDEAINNKKWFNLVLHSFNNDDEAIVYAHSKNIWVAPIGTVIKYILQRDRFILTNYNVSPDRITFNASRLQVPSAVSKNFEEAFGQDDLSTMQIDIDDTKILDKVLVNGVINPYQTIDLNGNKVLRTNVKLDHSSNKTVEVIYKFNLTISGVTANNKVYDGTTSAILNTGGALLVGVTSGDVVTLVSSGATGTFINPNAGSGKSVSTSGFTLSGADAGKYTLTSPTTSGNITTLALTVSGLTVNNKIYNGTTAATLNTTSASLAGVLPGDAVNLVFTNATGTFVNKNVGTTKLVNISGITVGGAGSANYALIQPSSSADITPLALTVSGVTANDKVYDGTAAATLNTGGSMLVGVLPGDVVTLVSTGATGSFANQNIGTAKIVSISGFALLGPDAGNYTLTQPTTLANITALSLTVSGITANNKVYDGTTSATLNTGGAAVAGVLPGDIVTLSFAGATGTFVNKNAGTAKSVTISGIALGGASAGNYTLTQPSSSADITTAILAVSGVTANTKVYNGTTSATLNTGSAVLTGVFGTDVVVLITAGATGTFASTNVGTAIVVTTSGFALGGTDSNNYILTQPSTTGNITGIILTVTGVTADNKVYDGTTAATLNNGSAALTGVFPGNSVTLVSAGATGTFVNKNVGTTKSVTTSGFTLGGDDAGNYTLAQPVITANITTRELTVGGSFTANNKVYDGTTAATILTNNLTLTGKAASDDVALTAVAVFAGKDVGTGIIVRLTGSSLAGTDAPNYTLSLTGSPTTAATITLSGLTVTGITANNKTYNGTTAATLNTAGANLVGVVPGDAVTLVAGGASGNFDTKSVGSGKLVRISDITISGPDAWKYTLIQPTSTASIISAGLTVTGVLANNKVYDGKTSATLDTEGATLIGFLETDYVSLVSTYATGTFINKNVGTSKSVSTSGFTITGADAGNYTLTQPTTSANITPVGITVSGVKANNKVYNGTTAATLNTGSASLVGVLGGDIVNLVFTGGTGTFVSKNTGTAISVTISGISLGGSGAGNYTLTQPSSSADITPFALTVSGLTVINKIYDGTTAATLNAGGAFLVGVVPGDVVIMDPTGATGFFVNKNAGTAKSVTISGITIGGASVSNYTITQPTTSANITPLKLSVTGVTANSKVYNGTTSATLNTGSAVLAGVLPGDAVNLVFSGATGTFVNKNAGTAKSVIISGITLGGTGAGNYTLTQPTSVADITTAILTVSGVTANNKVYDGTYAATLNTGSAVLTGVFGTDAVVLITTGATGTFASANVGTAIVVRTSGFTLGGTDSINYTLTQPATAANITGIVLTVTGVTARNKVYDGTTIATLNTGSASLTGVLAGYIVTLVSTGARGTFVNKNVGTNKSVSTSGFSISGPDADKYILTQPTTSANITRLTLTISGLSANNKIYDGTTAVTFNTESAVPIGILPGDVVSPVFTGATGTFMNKNAGTAKPVIVSGITLGGAGSSNYSLIQPSSSADITPLALTITDFTANNKVYDGTTSATLNTEGALLSGVLPGDVVSLVRTEATGSFASPNIGTAKLVTTSGFTLEESDTGNYTLTQPTTVGNITALALTVSGVTADNKVYNGTTSTTLNTGSAILEGVLPGDAVTLIFTGATGTFVNKNAGTAKSVTISGFTLGGTSSGNYTLTQPSTAADITTASLTVSGVTANNKVYNRTTSATLNTGSAVLTGVFGTDAVVLITTGATGTFASANVGTAIIVTASGFVLGGTDANNYILTQPATTGNIIGIVLTVSGVTANNKEYDGTTSATLNTGSAALTGILSGNIVTLVSTGATGTFANKNVGTNNSVLTSGFYLGGADAGNYSLIQPAITANITTRELTIGGSFTANNKVYDGTTAATILTNSLTLTGKAASDDVALTTVAVFAGKDVGTGIIVRLTGSSLAGTDAPNYTLSLTGSPTTTATIALFGLTVTGVRANNKIYDGTSIATLNTDGAVLVGILGNDIVELVSTEAAGNFVNKNAGSDILVTITGLNLGGTDAWKYTLVQPTSTASITSTSLTVARVFANNKVYDGTTSATLNTEIATIFGVLGNDDVSLISTRATGSFVNMNAGIGKKVLTTGFSIRGNDVGNYTLTQPSATADITLANLKVSGVTTYDKDYDGTTAATLNTVSGILEGVFGSDEVTLISDGAAGNFSDKNVGIIKSVSSSGFRIGGANAGNYLLTQPSLVADISPKMLIIKSKDLSKPYGESLTFTGTEVITEGLVTGDAVPAVLINSPGAQSSASVGEYIISLSDGSDPNYSYTYVNGILAVKKSVIIATADNKNKTYGAVNPALSITYSGFRKNEDASMLDAAPVITTNALKTSNVGSYSISLSGGSDNNYDLVLVHGILNIVKAPLTIKAENKAKVFRETNPDLNLTYSGFVLGQDQNVLHTLPIIVTDAKTYSDAGEYDITVYGADDSNYSFIYNKGKLTIMKGDQTIIFESIPAGLRMTETYRLNASASSDLDVSYEVSNPNIVTLNGDELTVRRDGKLAIKAIQEGDNNWNPAPEAIQIIETLPTFDAISSLFTPNNDGMNDYWHIPEIEEYGRLEVTVYNRFGQSVYHSDSYNNDWDGTWNGNPLPSASYYYIIKSTNKGFLKGVVNIAR